MPFKIEVLGTNLMFPGGEFFIIKRVFGNFKLSEAI